MRSTMMRYPLVLPRALERAETLYADREIVSRLGDRSLHRYGYGAMAGRARRLADALRKAGLKPGERVGTLMWNHHIHLEAYFGIPGAGGVMHTLNLRLQPDELAFIASHAGDRVLIVDDVLLPLARQFVERTGIEKVVVARISDEPTPDGYEDYESFIADGDPAQPLFEPEDEFTPSSICYTSGTTGRPKGVAYSHRALMLHAMCLGMKDGWDLGQTDAAMPIVPMFHVNAWNFPYASTLVGAKQVLPGPHLDPESLLDLMAGEGVSITGAVPTIWFAVVDALRAEPGRWALPPGMRVIVGGASPPPALLRALDSLGTVPIHGWGMTETTAGATMAHVKPEMADWPRERVLDLFTERHLPVPLVEVRVVGDEGEAPWDGAAMGELQIRAPWVAAGYHDAPGSEDRWTDDETGSGGGDGWFRTGDVANIDAAGFVKICDRTRDLVKSGGEWISSQDLENAIMGHPDVKEAAVIALPHPKWGERPLACVVPRAGAKIDAEDLAARLAAEFPKWWLPDAYEFIDEVPKTSTGKFQKTALRERYADWRWEG
ncbi:MAG: long-chain fatty acid--CoA ligase [Rhodospirillaceae bacterium]|jgi:fatty-acyl-CoA synthase|nr:long-chain fatty acid--CoA ligase [Rhodospirillaceae bacterium]